MKSAWESMMCQRLLRIVGVLFCGSAFQLLGCASEQVGEIVARGMKSTAVEVSTLVVGSIVDNAFGLE
ncbi:MAG: hypothetical protein ACE5HE_07085 [Phycisphaerae bacterium]